MLTVINWIKDLFFNKDDTLIGLTRLNESKISVRKVPKKKIKKENEDIKISDLIKGEI